MAITIEEGHELKPFEALLVIVGLFFKFTIVKLKGPNKRNNNKKKAVTSLRRSWQLGFKKPKTILLFSLNS